MSTAPITNGTSTPLNTEKKPKPSQPPPSWRIPKLRLIARDLASSGSRKFLSAVKPVDLLQDAIIGVNKALYGSVEAQPSSQRSVTLFLEGMGGVAYTTGSELDKDHKEIHFSNSYIANIAAERLADEVSGVIWHEMVHVWQNDAMGTAPGGLIEGIADWVRLKAGFVPPHWKRGGTKWDDGYQNTAYFLEWLEKELGEGTVRRINALLGQKEYNVAMWEQLSGGSTVDELWGKYQKHYDLNQDFKPKENAPLPPQPDGQTKPSSPDPDLVVVEKPTINVSLPNPSVYNAAPPPPQPSFSPEATEGEPALLPLSPRVTTTRRRLSETYSLASSHPSDLTFDPFPFASEDSLLDILKERLKNLAFDGSGDGKRFVRDFERLVGRVLPDVGEEEKRLLFTTCFKGYVNEWYEETDLEDEMPYEQLKELLSQAFHGKSKRKAKIVERDAKLE